MCIRDRLHPEKLGKRVVFMGGGLVGAEGAVGFAHEGKEDVYKRQFKECVIAH